VYDFTKVECILKESIGPDRDAPGAVLSVRRGDSLVFHGAYGYRQVVPRRLPMTEETLFDIASLTKSVGTALAVMQLCAQGMIDLDEKVSAYVPEIGDEAKKPITVRDLLANTSGLPSWRPYYKEVTAHPGSVDPQVVYRRILDEPLEVPKGTAEIYSDLGYMLLGWVLERVTGEPLECVFARLVFAPLGLVSTGFLKDAPGEVESGEARGGPCRPHAPAIASTEWCPWRGRVLTGEVHDENCYVMGKVAGHAGLFSTARELDRIAEELMKGYYGDSAVFGTEGVRTFLRRQTIVKGGTWALGWDTPSPVGSASGRYFSKNSFGHNGFTGTSIWMDLDRGVAVVFLTNRIHPTRAREGIRRLRPAVHNAVMESLGLA
jgi:CubicO group peptidase (beta-lactamase class C family)